jgi:hypothetical protein
MEIKRDVNLVNKTAETIAPIVSENSVADILREHVDEKDYDPRTKKLKAKKLKHKPSSINFINNDENVKDLVDNFAEKMADKEFVFEQQKIQAGVKQKLEYNLKEFLKGDIKEKFKDAITISEAAKAFKKDAIKKGKTVVSQGFSQEEIQEQAITGKIAGVAINAAENNVKEMKKNRNSPGFASAVVESSEITSEIREYLTAYTETLLKGNSKSKQKTEALRTSLLKKGFSLHELKQLESNIKRVVHTDLKKQIKRGYLKYVLSYAPRKICVDLLRNRNAFNDLERLGVLTGLFDQGELADIKDSARSDLRGFIQEELDTTLTVHNLQGASTKELVAAFDQFNALAGVAKFDPKKYLVNFNKKLDDMGLIYCPGAVVPGHIDTETDSGSNKKKRDSFALEGISEEEVEGIEDQLRLLFMKRVLKGGSSLDIRGKIRKLKLRLKDSGADYKKIMNRMRDEGESFAKVHLINSLREAFEERASLLKFKGPAFDLINRKMKIILKGLKTLGSPVLKSQAREIRDEINKVMFPIIKEEYIKVELQLSADPKCFSLKKKCEELVGVLERLKAESNIKEEIKPKMFADKRLASENSIMEAA